MLAEIKADPDLKTIPVVVLTSSSADEDVLRAYQLQCNCYITKPVVFKDFLKSCDRSRTSGWRLSPCRKARSAGSRWKANGAPTMRTSALRVLLVEDSPSDAALLQEHLLARGV